MFFTLFMLMIHVSINVMHVREAVESLSSGFVRVIMLPPRHYTVSPSQRTLAVEQFDGQKRRKKDRALFPYRNPASASLSFARLESHATLRRRPRLAAAAASQCSRCIASHVQPQVIEDDGSTSASSLSQVVSISFKANYSGTCGFEVFSYLLLLFSGPP